MMAYLFWHIGSYYQVDSISSSVYICKLISGVVLLPGLYMFVCSDISRHIINGQLISSQLGVREIRL